MPINKETIISVFTEKLTLEQWLKTINKALDEAVLTGVEIAKKGNATLSFKFTFEDGTFLETNDIVLQQGESVNGAYIQNGHLYLTLTNSQTLDAGNVKPVSNFSINDSQHLIVNYADGTSQDLGAIFQGNVNISGNFTADSIIENMSGYSAGQQDTDTHKTITNVFTGAVKNGNKLTLVSASVIEVLDNSYNKYAYLCRFTIPIAVGTKLYPAFSNVLDTKKLSIIVDGDVETQKEAEGYIQKADNNTLYFRAKLPNDLEVGKTYYIRYEATFLLSDNLIN